MYISKLSITNYRGIKERREISLEQFSSIVGRNDAGKTIVLYARASYFDVKSFPITFSDFNDIEKPIIFEFEMNDENLKDSLISKLKVKVKKNEGLEEYVDDFIFNGKLKYKKEATKPDKKFTSETILVEDYKQVDIQNLYRKTDEELNELISQYQVQIPVDGKGRNSKLEKIKYIKEFFKNSERTSFWIEDDCKISSLFPEVELFKADYGLEADTKFKTNSVSEIQDYFDRENESDETKLKKVEIEIIEEMKKEAISVRSFMKEYASNLKEVQILPSISWKDAIKGVEVSFQFEEDDKFIPMSHKGTGYRRLFMVARFRYLAEKNKGKNIIYLIEEPETFLHPSAQLDLLNAFKDLSLANQIIITTHSPIFAGATSVKGVVLCNKFKQSNYENSANEYDHTFLKKIVDELGIKPSFNLLEKHESIVFVESQNDAEFYNEICSKVLQNTFISNEKILVLPFGGGEDIESFLNIEYFEKSGKKLYLIIDSDKSNNKQEKQLNRARNFKQKPNAQAYVLERSCLENYYHPRALERLYLQSEGTFHFFANDENAQDALKKIITEKGIKNLKIKNNINVFKESTKEEFIEVVENELIKFLSNILE